MVRRGEIYLYSFDLGRGREQRGPRPALVIQNDLGNEFSETTIVAAMTSREGPAYPFRSQVSPTASGLREPSTVMLDQVHTVEIGRLKRRIGRLTPEAMLSVDHALRYSFGLID